MRRAALLLSILALAGCGGDGGGGSSAAEAPNPNRQHFVSRPDLEPPRVEVKTDDADAGSGDVFLAAKEKETQGGPMILDPQGRLIWFRAVQPLAATDFRVQTYKGKPVLTWWEGHVSLTGVGDGNYKIVDDGYRTITEFRAGNDLAGDLHEFLLTPQGTALISIYEPLQRDLSSVGGPKRGWVYDSIVQEIDVATHEVVWQWRSLDHVPVDESISRKPAQHPTAKAPFDYFHVNSIDVDRDGNLLVSARNTHAFYKVDRKTGDVLWTVGGNHSDFAMGPGTKFGYQHDVRRQDDGTITLFDNSATPPIAKFSRALVLRVDESAKKVTLVHAYTHPQKLLSPHQGNSQRLPNGNTFVGWGGKPWFTEFALGGDVVFDATFPIGDSYRVYRFPWHAKPTDHPAIVVRGDDAYVSWNGATDVAKWQLVAGKDEKTLKPVGDAVAKGGFETKLVVDTDAKLVAVRALDRAGKVLGESFPTDR